MVRRDVGQSLILVGMDGSACVWRALHYAIGVRQRQPGRLVVIHAVHIPAYARLDNAVGSSIEIGHHALECAKEGAGELADTVRDIGLESGAVIEYLRVDDNLTTALIRAASTYHADLVVVGGKGRFGRRFLGSVEAGVVRSCKCPVTVVP